MKEKGGRGEGFDITLISGAISQGPCPIKQNTQHLPVRRVRHPNFNVQTYD